MKAMDEKKETEKAKPVTIKAAIRDEEGHKKVEKVDLEAHKVDTLKYVEKKLVDKGVQRMERHPADGLPFARPPPKAGHGGKYTWEGPADEAENELDPAPPAIDEKDPNYVDEEVVKEVDGVVVGVVEVPKAAKEGVQRLKLTPT